MKKVTVKSQIEIDQYMEAILKSCEQTQLRLRDLAQQADSWELLHKMKFEKLGSDPLDSARRLNLIEQLNQTFTYAASFKAAEYLLKFGQPFTSLTLNLGTESGWDIESSENGGLASEVFAAVDPQNNRKLEKDIAKVATAPVALRYVFFMCPDVTAGPYRAASVPIGVSVVSLGCGVVEAPTKLG